MVKSILVIHVSIIVTVHVQQLRAKHRYREEKLLDEILWCDHSLVAMVGRSVAWWHKKTAARETKQTAVEENNKKLICLTILCMITLRNKMVACVAGVLKGKGKGILGKGVLGARKTRGTRGLAPKFPSPSLSNACHEGKQNGGSCFSSIVWHALRCAKQHKAFASYLPKMSLNLGSNSIWYFSTYSKSSSVPNTLAILTSWK